MSVNTTKIELAVYDLSRGMAMMMSQQILGQRIDGIYHTGVVIFGFEYYFGGGIQCTPYGAFTAQNNLPPQQLLHLGNTTKTRSELESYLRTIRHLYSMQTYDLINNNCNNFSDAVVKFLTSDSGNAIGIPSYIVDLPRIVFSTPGGAMLRPMIENMQRGIQSQTSGMNSLDPFGGGGTAGGRGYSSSENVATTTSSSTLPPSSSFAPTFSYGINSNTSTSTSTSTAFSSTDTSRYITSTPEQAQQAIVFENKLSETIMSNIELMISDNKGLNTSSIILDPLLINTPVIFKEAGNIKNLTEKILNALVLHQNVSELDKKNLNENMLHIVSTLSTTDATTLTTTQLIRNYDLFLKFYFIDPALHLSYLSIIRYLVLQSFICMKSTYLSKILRSIIMELSNPKGFKESAAIRTIAYTVLVNTLSHSPGAYLLLTSHTRTTGDVDNTITAAEGKEDNNTATDTAIQSKLMDVTIEGLTCHNNKIAIKTMASALALNLTLASTTMSHPTAAADMHTLSWNIDSSQPENELHPCAVQLLCSIIEIIESETNDIIRQRELIILYHILKHYHNKSNSAKSLANDLGLDSIIHSLITTATHQHTIAVNNSTEAEIRKNEALLIREIHKFIT